MIDGAAIDASNGVPSARDYRTEASAQPGTAGGAATFTIIYRKRTGMHHSGRFNECRPISI